MKPIKSNRFLIASKDFNEKLKKNPRENKRFLSRNKRFQLTTTKNQSKEDKREQK